MTMIIAIFMAMYRSVNVADLKNHLSEYLDAVEKGDELTICRRNVAVARITALPLQRNRTKLGFDRGKVKLHGAVTGPAVPADHWNALRDDVDPLP